MEFVRIALLTLTLLTALLSLCTYGIAIVAQQRLLYADSAVLARYAMHGGMLTTGGWLLYVLSAFLGSSTCGG